MAAGLETFAKVRALHDRTDNAGEKAAAASRMEALARRAGMTVAEAISKLDRAAPASPKPPGPSWDDVFNNAFWQQARADADRERAAKWRRVLAEYGSEEAVFAPTPWEIALERACDRFVVRKSTTGWRIGSLWGWDIFSPGDPAPEIVQAVSNAYPLPANVQEAWNEHRAWDKLARDREAHSVGSGDPAPWVRVRTDLIERMANTMPAASLDDIRARLTWMEFLNSLENAPDPKEEAARLAALRADVEALAVRFGQAPRQPSQGFTGKSQNCGAGCGSVQNGQPEGIAETTIPLRRTNAEKRRDVLALLNAENAGIGPLADREIARRAGVSPQTVGNIRRACGSAGTLTKQSAKVCFADSIIDDNRPKLP